MCNLAQVKQYDCVIDPFSGTGSLLIPPTHYGAFVFGCDLDIRVLKGYSVGYVKTDDKKGSIQKEGNIFTNFDIYQLPRPQIFRQDINHPPIKKQVNFFDAIICDPPYGFRACSKKSGLSDIKKEKRGKRIKEKIEKVKDDIIKSKEEDNDKDIANQNTSTIKENKIEEFDPNVIYGNGEIRSFTPLQQCEVSQIFDNLLSFGAEALKQNGLLVCLFPTKKSKSEQDLVHLPCSFPQNPLFKLIHACENKYSLLKSRWCLVYKKL